MKKLTVLIMMIACIASCSSTKKTTAASSGSASTSTIGSSKQDGSSFENAVFIKEKSESKGVDAEYSWLREHYPGYTTNGQSLVFQGKKPYDLLKITTKEGENKTIYFDISGFFGKF